MIGVKTTSGQFGATVLELVVYLSLFSLISAGSLTLLFSMHDLYVGYRVKQYLFTSSTATLERLLVEARQAETVNLSDSVFGSTTKAVVVFEQGLNEVRVAWDNESLNITRNGEVVEQPLHNNTVKVTEAIFYHYEREGRELVRFAITFEANLGGHTETLLLKGGAGLRGSYGTP